MPFINPLSLLPNNSLSVLFFCDCRVITIPCSLLGSCLLNLKVQYLYLQRHESRLKRPKSCGPSQLTHSPVLGKVVLNQSTDSVPLNGRAKWTTATQIDQLNIEIGSLNFMRRVDSLLCHLNGYQPQRSDEHAKSR